MNALEPLSRGTEVAWRHFQPDPHGEMSVSYAVAARVVSDDGKVVVLSTAPGSEVQMRSGAGGGPKSRTILPTTWTGDYEKREWTGSAVVRVHRRGDSWSVWRWHDAGEWYDDWYGNLESPWTRDELGFATRDWALDVVASGEPGSSEWEIRFKDEDELAWMVEHGSVSPGDAATVRAAGPRRPAVTGRPETPLRSGGRRGGRCGRRAGGSGRTCRSRSR